MSPTWPILNLLFNIRTLKLGPRLEKIKFDGNLKLSL